MPPPNTSPLARVSATLVERCLEPVPEPLRRLMRRGRAELRARALGYVPLPLYELWRFKSLDPFIARATSATSQVGGKHFLVLAGVPMADSGGGQRPAQLTLELLERGHRVTYVFRFDSRESAQHRRGYTHPNLTQVSFDDFSARRFALEREGHERLIALCEIPLAEFRLCLRYLQLRGVRTLYDCIDEWDSSLGGGWYARSVEQKLAAEADLVLASSRLLKEGFEARSGRQVALLPNAVNTRLFDRGRDWKRPSDLPRGDGVFLYVGSLWGEWFDWEWIGDLARARPQSQVVLIGDNPAPRQLHLPNLHLLGLRPQAEIPAYLAHSDVCLIPFKLDRLVRAVSPLKVFEYLAMGKPVVASQMPELDGYPGVLTCADAEGFVEQAQRARDLVLDEAQLRRFVAENSWKARARQLERLVDA